jgi:solute carrier family 27 fatty acid transporter 1/4
MINWLIGYICIFVRVVFYSILAFPRDFLALKYRFEIDSDLKVWRKKRLTVTKVFEENVRKHPNKACIVFDDETWSFKQVSVFSIKCISLLQH